MSLLHNYGFVAYLSRLVMPTYVTENTDIYLFLIQKKKEILMCFVSKILKGIKHSLALLYYDSTSLLIVTAIIIK